MTVAKPSLSPVHRAPARRGRLPIARLLTWALAVVGLGCQAEPSGEYLAPHRRYLVEDSRPGDQDPGRPRGSRVALDNDQRSALPAAPSPEWRLEIPAAAVLRFAYGLAPEIESACEFRVSARGPDGSPRVLFSAVVDPAGGGPAGWQEASVDLAPFAGRRLTLRFDVDGAVPDDPAGAGPVWANPEILIRVAEPRAPNVVLVSLDTLRADHLSLYGYGRLTSPHLDRWARRRGIVFLNTVASSPWTLPSHVSLFTGLDALRHGVNYGGEAPASLRMLAELLHDAGYRTEAVTGGGYVGPNQGFTQGFDSFSWPQSFAAEDELEAGLANAVGRLRRNAGRPFFLFFHTYEIHAPFRPREPYFSRLRSTFLEPPAEGIATRKVEPDAAEGFVERKEFVAQLGDSRRRPLRAEELPLVTDLYDAGIAYTDAMLQGLFSTLEELDLERRTIVVVTSDHGEALGEKGLAGHSYLYDFNLMVPLIFALPDGMAAGRVVSEQVSLVDVLPTLLELVGLDPPPGLDGATLLPLIQARAPDAGRGRIAWSYGAISNYGLALRVANRLKLISNDTVWPPAAGREELFDLLEDPAEEHDLAATGGDELEVLRRLVDEVRREQAGGLRIELTNRGQETLTGTLNGSLVRKGRLKSVGRSCRCLRWSAKYRAAFEIPAGERLSLRVEGTRSHDRKLTIELQGFGADTSESLDPTSLTEVWRRVSDGSSWRRVASDDPGALASIAVGWQRGTLYLGHAPALDAAQRRRLAALGYLQQE